MSWHQAELQDVYRETGSGPNGLFSSQAKEKIKINGLNELMEKKAKNWASIFLTQFKDVLILVLLAAAIFSGIIGGLKDTIVIVIIIVLNAVVGFIQEFRAEKAMQALKQMAIAQAKVMRDGVLTWISSGELVQGDLVFLEAGNVVPADIRVIESNSLKIEEAALTGESHPVEKFPDRIEKEDIPIGDRHNMVFKGTYVTYGRGKGVVVATGMQTELGRIAQMLHGDDTLTPLQQRMAAFGKRLSVIIGFLCLLFLTIGLLRGEDFTTMTLTSISLAVAAIPEALPAVITISLALAARKLVRYNALIRRLPAVETLGSVTYICTDKTGTLTKNEMHVEEVYVHNKVLTVPDLKYLTREKEVLLLLKAFALNNDSMVDSEGVIKGDSTEVALMRVAVEVNHSWNEVGRLSEIAFDSGRKLMTTFHADGEAVISFTKGAPDVLLQRCTGVDKLAILDQVDGFAKMGYRVLGFACRQWESAPLNLNTEEHETGLTFIGLAAIIDPPRPEVYEAVSRCKSAGIIPVMITGDHPLTAKTIAERIGILEGSNDLVLTGIELAKMDKDDFSHVVEKTRVYARVSPEQKLQIVEALQAKGQYVAMTGDGVNDAPSLKKANIGIAMGITGTDVSKEAAHMILLDDNFSTIVNAIKEGRRIYDNILKFIKFLMTTNASEVLTLLLGPLIGLPIALLPIHILWINLVSDGLPAITLSFEKAEKGIMSRPPIPPQESVFANGRGVHMLCVGTLMAGIALGLQAWSISNGLHWQTMVFNFMCLAQFANVMAIRSGKESLFTAGLFSNKSMLAAITGSLILQGAITFIPFFQGIFHTEALTMTEFLIVFGSATLVFVAVEMEKYISRIRQPLAAGIQL